MGIHSDPLDSALKGRLAWKINSPLVQVQVHVATVLVAVGDAQDVPESAAKAVAGTVRWICDTRHIPSICGLIHPIFAHQIASDPSTHGS